MNKAEITSLSRELLIKYYNNETELFLSCLDKEARWYGPAIGQVLRGKPAMISAWASEQNPLTFTMGSNIITETISAGPSMCIVVLSYSVTTHYPSGTAQTFEQRLSLTWVERRIKTAEGQHRRLPRILMCDITNPHSKSQDDTIYPVHSEKVLGDLTPAAQPGYRLTFKGPGGKEYFLDPGTIVWGDSCYRGRHCMLHLSDGNIVEVTASVKNITEANPNLFLRCHASHLVNPTHVKGVRRFAVIMMDDTELPIPEKSYTAFKRRLEEFPSLIVC